MLTGSKVAFIRMKSNTLSSIHSIFVHKIDTVASEEVILSLIKTKCLPCLLFCVKLCPLNKSEFRSLNFTVTRVLMKLFRTFSNSVIQDCQHFFNFPSVDTLVRRRTITFLRKYGVINNSLTNVFVCDAHRQLASALISFYSLHYFHLFLDFRATVFLRWIKMYIIILNCLPLAVNKTCISCIIPYVKYSNGR